MHSIGEPPISAFLIGRGLQKERASAVEGQLAGNGDTTDRRTLDGGERLSERRHAVATGLDRGGIDRHLWVQGFGLGGALAASIAPPSASATLRHARRLVI